MFFHVTTVIVCWDLSVAKVRMTYTLCAVPERILFRHPRRTDAAAAVLTCCSRNTSDVDTVEESTAMLCGAVLRHSGALR